MKNLRTTCRVREGICFSAWNLRNKKLYRVKDVIIDDLVSLFDIINRSRDILFYKKEKKTSGLWCWLLNEMTTSWREEALVVVPYICLPRTLMFIGFILFFTFNLNTLSVFQFSDLGIVLSFPVSWVFSTQKLKKNRRLSVFFPVSIYTVGS